MKFTVTKSVLVKELDAIIGSVEKKSTIPILSNCLIEAKENQLLIAGTDLDVSATAYCFAEVQEQGAICLPAAKLLAIVKSVTGKEIQFALGENDRVTIKCGRSKFQLAGVPGANFPNVAVPNVDFRQVPAGAFGEMLTRTRFAISETESRFTCGGVNLEIEESVLRCVATDGHRLALAEHSWPSLSGVEFKGVVPKRAVNEIVRLSGLSTTVGVAFTEKQAYFQFDNRTLSTRLLAGQFPNWQMIVLKKQPRIKIEIAASELLQLLNRVGQLADIQTRAVIASIANNELAVSTPASEQGLSDDAIVIDYSDEPWTAAFNFQYLTDYLSAVNDKNVCFELGDPREQVVLRLATEDQAERSLSVIMPMRI